MGLFSKIKKAVKKSIDKHLDIAEDTVKGRGFFGRAARVGVEIHEKATEAAIKTTPGARRIFGKVFDKYKLSEVLWNRRQEETAETAPTEETAPASEVETVETVNKVSQLEDKIKQLEDHIKIITEFKQEIFTTNTTPNYDLSSLLNLLSLQTQTQQSPYQSLFSSYQQVQSNPYATYSSQYQLSPYSSANLYSNMGI